MTKDPTWHQSQMWLIENCGERYRREVVEGEKAPPTARMARGSAVHYVAAEAHKKQMADRGEWDGEPSVFENSPGSNEATKEAKDIAATAFENQKRSGMTFASDEVKEGIDKVANRSKDVAVALSSLYVGSVAPRVYPIAVERRIIVKPKDMDVGISGTIDLIERIIPETPTERRVSEVSGYKEAIIDEKTGEKQPSKNAANESKQLTMYALIRMAQTGKLPDKTSLVHLIRTPKRGDLHVIRQDSVRTMDDVGALVNRLNRAIESVKRGVFMPNTNWWGCSPRWCPFWSTCPFPEGKERQAVEE